MADRIADGGVSLGLDGASELGGAEGVHFWLLGDGEGQRPLRVAMRVARASTIAVAMEAWPRRLGWIMSAL